MTLLSTNAKAVKEVEKLRTTKLTEFKAKDIFRALQLSLLGVSNSHVVKNQKKIINGSPISPILLVCSKEHGRVVVADGFHHLCAV